MATDGLDVATFRAKDQPRLSMDPAAAIASNACWILVGCYCCYNINILLNMVEGSYVTHKMLDSFSNSTFGASCEYESHMGWELGDHDEGVAAHHDLYWDANVSLNQFSVHDDVNVFLRESSTNLLHDDDSHKSKEVNVDTLSREASATATKEQIHNRITAGNGDVVHGKETISMGAHNLHEHSECVTTDMRFGHLDGDMVAHRAMLLSESSKTSRQRYSFIS
ncbi:hypothetical protein AMTR_s00139p00102940 [Amborella trichopoda]|uniref:Uncharacterized protein n=1 Tax=Amborella trichopoda TaxID=13333 RepID=W1NEN3_AMBTC|nr:hypothetical protein AMTR_s00139p00102940 [Amborella trichopoda]